jgi:cell division protein FtsI (penicillin-binding protein 3)
MIDQMKQSIDAEEILVGVMESQTGKVLSLASTERYNPSHITQQDIAALNPKFAEYPYEAGSVVKPLTLAIALDHQYVTPDTWFNTFNGKMKIGNRRTITDDDKFDALTCTDIIVHSSNVGISQVSWKLTGKEFREGLLKFGVAKPSGIDLSRDLPGQLKPLRLLDNKMHRANSSYGYGMLITFAQLFKAYSAFNNDGIAVTPRLVDYLADDKGRQYKLDPKVGDSQAVGKKAANQIHDILLEVVKRGTGVKAQYPGLEVGGKTGTSHIAKNGHYVREYHSSFYGFVNDKEGHKYTIGVLVIRAKKFRHYFASLSAVPTFKRTMDILVELDYLKPEDGIIAPSPEINIEPKVIPDNIPEIITEAEPETKPTEQPKTVITQKIPKIQKEVKTVEKPVVRPASSVKELFKMNEKPKTQKVVAPPKAIAQPRIQTPPRMQTPPKVFKPQRPAPAQNRSAPKSVVDLF